MKFIKNGHKNNLSPLKVDQNKDAKIFIYELFVST